jgi:ferritin-like metal-binding protein YciE
LTLRETPRLRERTLHVGLAAAEECWRELGCSGRGSSNKSHEGDMVMSVKTPQEVFVLLLSNVRQSTERTSKIFQEISQAAQNPDVKEALEARMFVSQQILEKLDQCFKLIGAQPVKAIGRLQEIFVEDFRKELAEIESPIARHLYILAKANHLIHLRIGEYVALVAAADMTGHYGVGVLLESCLADKLAFVERTRRLIRHMIEGKVAAKLAA